MSRDFQIADAPPPPPVGYVRAERHEGFVELAVRSYDAPRVAVLMTLDEAARLGRFLMELAGPEARDETA